MKGFDNVAFNTIHFNNFINSLQTFSGSSTVTNQYLSTTQIDNLKKYLISIEALNPTVLFVGEAPGYKGCAITGIPFTSEFIINKKSKSGVFNGCTVIGRQKESSATILWDKLDDKQSKGKLNVPPLLWNIFPFHPHDNGNSKSNRKPRIAEVIIGLNYLNNLINLFPSIKTIYAIGKVSDDTIYTLPKYAGFVRHPSNGGKPKFMSDIDIIYP